MNEENNPTGPIMIVIGALALLIGIITICTQASSYTQTSSYYPPQSPSSAFNFSMFMLFGGIIILIIGIGIHGAGLNKRQDRVMGKFLKELDENYPEDQAERVKRRLEKQLTEDRERLERLIKPPRLD